MNTGFGKLKVVDVKGHERLLADAVARAAAAMPVEDIGVAEIDASFSDTKQFCEQYEIGTDRAANCVVLEARRGDRTWFAACVVLGNARADVNGLARRTLDARVASFASMEKAVAATGMEYGAITPIGLPSEWPILIDKAVTDSECVIIGSGKRESKLLVSGRALSQLINVQVLERLGNKQEA